MEDDRGPVALLLRRVDRVERVDVRSVDAIVAPQRKTLLRDDLELWAVLVPDALRLFGGGLEARAVDEAAGAGKFAEVSDGGGRVVHAEQEGGQAGLGEGNFENDLVDRGADQYGDDGDRRELGCGRASRDGRDDESDGYIVLRNAINGAL